MNRLKTYIKPFLNRRFLVAFGIAWGITNGWCYIFIILGRIIDIQWMTNVGLAYLAFLWLPISPEKLITIPLAIFLHQRIFKNDTKTKEMLDTMHQQAKDDWNSIKKKIKGDKNSNG